MIQKSFVLFVAVLLVGAVALRGYADTEDALDVHLRVFSGSKGVSGDLMPHFSSDRSVGGAIAAEWRAYMLGIETAKFIGLRSMLGTSGHTVLFAQTQRKIGKYDTDVRYNYLHMQSMMPEWWPWADDNCHEVIILAHYPTTSRWHPYALAGLLATEGALSDTFTVVGGGGATTVFPVNRRIDFTVDVFAAAFLFSLSDQRKFFGKAGGFFSFDFMTLPLSLQAGLDVFKVLGDETKVWTTLKVLYTL